MANVVTGQEVTDNRSYFWIIPVVFLATLVAFFRMGYPLLNDNDVPWHLATGKFLLQTHHLPKTDPFAYGNQNQPWYLLSWLWDLIIGSVQSVFGELGAFIFTMGIGAALTAAICWRLLKLNIALPAVLMTTMLTALCLLDYITARPQLIGYALAFCYHALMHRSRGEAGYRSLFWLPLLMIVWSNGHGSFIVGFTIMGAYGLEAWFTDKREWMKRIILTGVVCAICILINPYGLEIIKGIMKTLGGSTTPYNQEWRPYSFGTSTGLSIWLAIIILTSNLRGAGIWAADKMLAMAWLLATMFSIRNGAFFILVSAPYLATCLDEQTRDLREPQPTSPLVVFMRKQPLKRVWLACFAAFWVLCGVASVVPHDNQIETEDFSIKDAINYATGHHPDHHFYVDYNLGGQVIYRTMGKLSYFMDSRAATAYSDDDMNKFIEFLKLSDGWQEMLAERHLNGIIVSKNMGFATAYENGSFRDKWKLVFAGKRANVYIARP